MLVPKIDTNAVSRGNESLKEKALNFWQLNFCLLLRVFSMHQMDHYHLNFHCHNSNVTYSIIDSPIYLKISNIILPTSDVRALIRIEFYFGETESVFCLGSIALTFNVNF